ncbi:MAG: PIN domain-containing protein [bacterium]|nr:PIN domain-containing protein [bacterium]
MSVFVDTSGLLAILDAGDGSHPQAATAWRELVETDEDLVSTNYVLVETFAVAQNRLGIDAVKTLEQDMVPLLRVLWIDPSAHHSAVSAVLAASRRQLSLVDCASFDAMRRHGLIRAFTFDRHFAEQGFESIPTGILPR